MNNELYDTLYRGISKVAWGYVFIFFNFNIQTFNILPAFVGYLLFLSAIGLLQEIEPELKLIRPFGIVLAIYNVIDWFSQLFSIEWGGITQLASIVICIVSVYFQFQLSNQLYIMVIDCSTEYDFIKTIM